MTTDPGLGRAGPASLLDRPTHVVALARHAVVVGLAGIATGVLVGGVGGRAIMRVSAVAAPDYATGAFTEGGNVVGDITVGGTIALIIFVGILGGIVGAVAYLIVEPWLGWAGRYRGVVFAMFLLAVLSTSAFDPANRDFTILGNQGLNVAMFAGLFIAFGLLIGPAIASIDRRLPGVDSRNPVRRGWGYLALAAFGAQFVVLFFLQFFNAEVSGAEQAPVLTGLLLVGLSVATLTHHLGLGRTSVTGVAGYGFLMAAALVGTLRAVDDISAILTI